MIDGVLYVTGFNNNAWAIDARSGRHHLALSPRPPGDLRLCCGAVNRGFAVLGDRLFMTTLDAHLVALDMKTGTLLFDVELDGLQAGYSATVAPLVVKDKVIVGVAGAEYGIRGFIDAYDVNTGKRRGDSTRWPAPASRAQHLAARPDAYLRGGGSIWVTGTYDPRAEPGVLRHRQSGARLLQRNAREGDNLYTASVVALDADTGKLKWHYPVHAARRARLGFHAGAGARRADDRRAAAQGRDVRQPQRVLLHARSRHRKADRRQAVRRDDVGEGNQTCTDVRFCCRATIPNEEGQQDVSRSRRRHQLHVAVLRSDAKLFFVTARETCAIYFAYDQKFKAAPVHGGRHVAAARSEELGRAARHRSRRPAERKWEFRYPTVVGVGRADHGARAWCSPATATATSWRFDSRTGKSAAEVAVDLKRRVEIQQVRQRRLREQRLIVLVRLLAVLEPRPEVDDPRAAPAGVSAAVREPPLDRRARRARELRRAAHVI